MKRIACFALVLLLLFGVLGFSSCAGDTRSPVIQEWEAVVVKQKKETGHVMAHWSMATSSKGHLVNNDDIESLIVLCQEIPIDSFIEGEPEFSQATSTIIRFFERADGPRYGDTPYFSLYITRDGMAVIEKAKNDDDKDGEKYYAYSTNHALTREDFEEYCDKKWEVIE